jgi:molecular chaperone DnaK
MASPVLGIDLGTTNSVVAIADGQRVRVLRDDAGRLLTASTVSFHPSGQILVGDAARERRLVDAENTVFSVKRLIGRPFRSPEARQAADRLPFKLEEGATGGVMVRARGELYSLPEISAFILREIKAIAERALGQSCVNAVITVPANFNELQRMATRDAARIAGLNVLRILNEPTAAALAYGSKTDAGEKQRIAVYDLGGGTFDISVLELSGDVIEVIATAGDTYLGGDDIDTLIGERMAKEFLQDHHVDVRQDAQTYERVRMAGEWIKCQLSMLDSAEATVKEVSYGPGGAPIDMKFKLTRAELDKMIFPLIARTFDICEDALRSAGVRPTQLDGVILVGGQTRTPKVRQMVAEYFGTEPQSSVDPDLVVAQGAALQGFALSGARAEEKSKIKTLSGVSASIPPGTSVQDAPRASIVPPTTSDVGFEDEPTRVAHKNEAPPSAATPFDDIPTVAVSRESVSTEPSDEAATEVTKRPDSLSIPAGSVPVGKMGVRTLMGVGSKAPPPVPAGARGAPKPPPIGAVLQSAKEAGASRPLAKTWPDARSGAPPAPPEPTQPEIPRAPRVPSVATPIHTDEETTERDLPAALRSSVAPPSAASEEEPIRTQSMARLLAAQGHKERALGIYDELIAKVPSDATLARERDVLRRSLVPSTPPPAPSAPVQRTSLSVSPPVTVSSPPPASAKVQAFPMAEPAPEPTRKIISSRPPSGVSTSQFPAAARPAPLLLDVTPHTLAVETVDGFCEEIIERNAPIPTEQTRIFSTSRDNQTMVSLRVCQGEGRRVDENQVLGQVELTGLRAAKRGQVSIAVTFIIDADGTLNVKAQDRSTGKAQAIKINLVGALAPQDVERIRARKQGGVTPAR